MDTWKFATISALMILLIFKAAPTTARVVEVSEADSEVKVFAPQFEGGSTNFGRMEGTDVLKFLAIYAHRGYLAFIFYERLKETQIDEEEKVRRKWVSPKSVVSRYGRILFREGYEIEWAEEGQTDSQFGNIDYKSFYHLDKDIKRECIALARGFNPQGRAQATQAIEVLYCVPPGLTITQKVAREFLDAIVLGKTASE